MRKNRSHSHDRTSIVSAARAHTTATPLKDVEAMCREEAGSQEIELRQPTADPVIEWCTRRSQGAGISQPAADIHIAGAVRRDQMFPARSSSCICQRAHARADVPNSLVSKVATAIILAGAKAIPPRARDAGFDRVGGVEFATSHWGRGPEVQRRRAGGGRRKPITHRRVETRVDLSHKGARAQE